MRDAAKGFFLHILLPVALIGICLHLAFPRPSLTMLIFGAVLILFGGRLIRRITARFASRALRLGNSKRAKRWYWLLRCTTWVAHSRSSCHISILACKAVEGAYSEVLEGLQAIERTSLDDALRAVHLNLGAYCRARLGVDLPEALNLVEDAILLRPQVQGFRHTRGLLHLELGNSEEATRDLEATFSGGPKDELLEAERCFDLGRLWSTRGYEEYAADYYDRSVQASPDSAWAQKAHSQPRTTNHLPQLDLLEV